MLKSLLVPLDHSAFAEDALVPAAAIARELGARLDLVLVHEQPKLANLRRSDWSTEQAQEENRYLERVASRLAAHGVEHCTYAVLKGDVEDAIIERAQSIDAGLIVMTSHGETGFSRARLGSVAYALVHESQLPVLVLRNSDDGLRSPRADALFRRILVPLDGSAASLTVLPAVMELAKCTRGTVVLLRVVEPVPMFGSTVAMSPADFATAPHPFLPTAIQDIEATERVCARARAELEQVAMLLADENIAGVESRVVVAPRVSTAILDFATATGVDLIAMSTQGRGLSRWLLGSAADAVLRSSKLPLLLSRPVKSGVSATAATSFRSADKLEGAHTG